MSWNNIVIEGVCFAEEKDGKYPCGQKYPTVFCLENGHCPHLGYSESDERGASWFVPLRLIIGDRIKMWLERFTEKIIWYFWERWFWEKKWQEFRVNMKVTECPAWDAQIKKSKDKFPEWFKVAKAELEVDI